MKFFRYNDGKDWVNELVASLNADAKNPNSQERKYKYTCSLTNNLISCFYSHINTKFLPYIPNQYRLDEKVILQYIEIALSKNPIETKRAAITESFLPHMVAINRNLTNAINDELNNLLGISC